MRRRALLSALAAGLAGTAGCLAGGPGEPASPTDTPTPTPDPTPATGPSPSPSPDGDPPVTTATTVFDPDVAVTLENDDDVAHEFALTVTGPEGVVHESTHDVDAGAELTPYDLSRADPDGIVEYEVAVAVGDQRESVTVETSSCYGGVVATVGGDGTLNVFYAIC